MYQAFRITPIAILILLLAISNSCRREPGLLRVGSTHLIVVDNADRAKKLLTIDTIEEYFTSLPPGDMALQMGSDTSVGIDLPEYREWVSRQFRPWKDELKQKILPLWEQVLEECEARFPGVAPDSIFLLTMADLPYGPYVYFTRNQAVMMPLTGLETSSPEVLLQVFRHELFHLISRRFRWDRPAWFRLSGFVSVENELIWNTPYSHQLLSNPDAPNYTYVLENGGDRYLPFLYHPNPPKAMDTPDRFSRNLRFGFLELAGDTVTSRRLPEWKAKGLARANTDYFIHPEEILAEHFTLLLGEKEADYPGELEELSRLLEQKVKTLPE